LRTKNLSKGTTFPTERRELIVARNGNASKKDGDRNQLNQSITTGRLGQRSIKKGKKKRKKPLAVTPASSNEKRFCVRTMENGGFGSDHDYQQGG